MASSDRPRDSARATHQTALTDALDAALRPAELDPEWHELLIAKALEPELHDASLEELRAAFELRHGLERVSAHGAAEVAGARGAAGEGPADDRARANVELANSLKVAFAPSPLPSARIDALVQRTLQRTPRRSNLIFVAFGAASAALALAAAIALLVGSSPRREVHTSKIVFAESRSSAPLFSERFTRESTSERVERIALTRGRELRENRFAAWGVR